MKTPIPRWMKQTPTYVLANKPGSVKKGGEMRKRIDSAEWSDLGKRQIAAELKRREIKRKKSTRNPHP